MTITREEAENMLGVLKRAFANAEGEDRVFVPELVEWQAKHRPTHIHYGTWDPIKRFAKKRGKDVVLCGSGPSLTLADIRDHDGIVVGVNEAAVVREADFCVVWDAPVLGRVRAALRNLHGMMWRENCPKLIVDEFIWFSDEYEWVRYDGLYYRRSDVVDAGAFPGTANVAIRLLYQAGFRKIKMVGFDAYFRWLRGESVAGQVALSSFVSDLRGAEDKRKDLREYDKIHEAMKAQTERLGIELVEVKP